MAMKRLGRYKYVKLTHDSKITAIYLQEIKKPEYAPLTKDEEHVVMNLFISGNGEAGEILIKRNLRLVWHVAKAYQNPTLYPTMELISAGNQNLITGIRRMPEKYDPSRSKSGRLAPYITNYIQGAMVNYVMNHLSGMETTLQGIEILQGAKKIVYGQLYDTYEEYLPIENRVDDIPTILDVEYMPSELVPWKKLHSADLNCEVMRSLGTLTERERQVICLFFGINDRQYIELLCGGPETDKFAYFSNRTPLTVDDIGILLDLERERVRQIKEKAIRRLRHKERSYLLKGYLG